MNFKPFEKIFDKKPKERMEKISLENGVNKQVDNEFNTVDFYKNQIIDGLQYDFHLSHRKGDKSWNLGFGTEHGMLVTNKGLAVYKQIIENVVILVNTARSNQKIDKISFFGSDEDLRINEFEDFKNFLKSKTENDTHILDNFSYVQDYGPWKRSVHIRNGEVSIEESGTGYPSIKERIKKSDTTWGRSDKFSIDQFVNNQTQMKEILQDKELLSSLMRHIGADFPLIRNSDHKDTANMRANLYERTLKQKFPDYKFERDGNTITLSL